jgi:hypothetical protein
MEEARRIEAQYRPPAPLPGAGGGEGRRSPDRVVGISFIKALDGQLIRRRTLRIRTRTHQPCLPIPTP